MSDLNCTVPVPQNVTDNEDELSLWTDASSVISCYQSSMNIVPPECHNSAIPFIKYDQTSIPFSEISPVMPEPTTPPNSPLPFVSQEHPSFPFTISIPLPQESTVGCPEPTVPTLLCPIPQEPIVSPVNRQDSEKNALICLSSGTWKRIPFCDSWSISHLKATIAEKCGCEKSVLSLQYQSKTLLDHRAISDYNIESNSWVNSCLPVRGGGRSKKQKKQLPTQEEQEKYIKKWRAIALKDPNIRYWDNMKFDIGFLKWKEKGKVTN